MKWAGGDEEKNTEKTRKKENWLYYFWVLFLVSFKASCSGRVFRHRRALCYCCCCVWCHRRSIKTFDFVLFWCIIWIFVVYAACCVWWWLLHSIFFLLKFHFGFTFIRRFSLCSAFNAFSFNHFFPTHTPFIVWGNRNFLFILFHKFFEFIFFISTIFLVFIALVKIGFFLNFLIFFSKIKH